MKDRSVCCLLVLVSMAACEGAPDVVADAAPPLTSSTSTSLAHHQAVFYAADTPDELWTQFQALHANVTPETALKVGRRIDGLLTAEARATYANAMTDSIRGLRIDPAVAGNTVENLRHRMLGDSAVARQARIKRCKLGGISQATTDRATLDIYDGAELVMQLPAVRERGAWRFLPSSTLFATYEELYPLPEDDQDSVPRLYMTAEEVANGLVAAINSGTAWDLYRMLDSGTKAQLENVLARSGTSEQDFVRALDSEIRALRIEHGRARVQSVTSTESNRSRIVIRYGDGLPEFADAVNDGGTWRLQLPL